MMQATIALLLVNARNPFLIKNVLEYKFKSGGATIMDFGNQIKNIRKKENLTQEQFALKLNVSRQTVSNWENNKNLPDIEMLILISNVFNVSLDELIKEDTTNNNLTKKIIEDGSETRRAQFNMITSIVGGGLLLLGILLLVVKGMSVEYIDADGVLHENFFLVLSGMMCILSGLLCFLSMGIKTLISQFKSKHYPS